jgi:hypothetical protein
MGKDRDEGLVDAAQNTLRQTTGALRGGDTLSGR